MIIFVSFHESEIMTLKHSQIQNQNLHLVDSQH